MAKENLEKILKSVNKIEKRVTGIYNVLTDIGLELCHVITDLKDYRLYRKDNPYY